MGWIDATPMPLATENIVKITLVNRLVSFREISKRNGMGLTSIVSNTVCYDRTKIFHR